jgi:hypothetical protein
MRKPYTRERIQMKRDDIACSALMLIVLAVFALSVSLWPELGDQLAKSLKAALRLYVGF